MRLTMLYELKRVREQSGKTRKQAAFDLGVPFNTYRNWEQCVNMPRDNEVLKRIATYFKVSIDRLLGFDGYPTGTANLKLAHLREKAGYKNSEQFATVLGIDPAIYKSWETSEKRISLEDARNIADFLNCTLDELAGRNTNESKAIVDWRIQRQSPREGGKG